MGLDTTESDHAHTQATMLAGFPLTTARDKALVQPLLGHQ